jgi:CHASE2 domain-containing sensor protein
MGPIRRTISLILALALFIVGLCGLCYLLLLAPWWKGWMVMAAGGMATLGGLWLWEDFINATPNEQK